jgi:hypothetical protein
LRPPLDNPRQNFLSLYPTTIYTFVDSVPQYGKNTEPHMYAQTIENIANWDTIGGQSLVGMMRESRNQSRLTALGISLDNNINDTLPYDQQKVLIANGSLPTGLANPNIPSGSTTANATNPFIANTTPIATAVTIQNNTDVTPTPVGNINDITGEFIVTDTSYITDITSVNNTNTNNVSTNNVNTNNDNTNTNTNTNNVNTNSNVNTVVIGQPIDIGDAVEPGSFAGSLYTNLIPPNLNSWYTSATLMPSTYTVNQAIDEVIRCNCDCWNLA